MRTRYASKAADVSRNDSVSPAVACTLYSFACLPARCGAPQSLKLIEPVTTASGNTGVSTHGLIVKGTVTATGEPIAPGAVTVIVPLCVPGARLPGVSVTTVESRGGAPPLGFERPSQPVSTAALQVRGREPVLSIRRVKVCGSALPANAVSARDVGDTDNSGAGGRMSKLTGTLTVLFACADVKTIVSWCGTCESVSARSVTTRLSGATPELVDKLLHVAVFVALHASVPPSAFVIRNVTVRGAVDPAFAEALRLSGVTAILFVIDGLISLSRRQVVSDAASTKTKQPIARPRATGPEDG